MNVDEISCNRIIYTADFISVEYRIAAVPSWQNVRFYWSII